MKQPDLLLTPQSVKQVVRRLREKHRLSATRAEHIVLDTLELLSVKVEAEEIRLPPTTISKQRKWGNLAVIGACAFLFGVVIYNIIAN